MSEDACALVDLIGVMLKTCPPYKLQMLNAAKYHAMCWRDNGTKEDAIQAYNYQIALSHVDLVLRECKPHKWMGVPVPVYQYRMPSGMVHPFLKNCYVCAAVKQALLSVWKHHGATKIDISADSVITIFETICDKPENTPKVEHKSEHSEQSCVIPTMAEELIEGFTVTDLAGSGGAPIKIYRRGSVVSENPIVESSNAGTKVIYKGSEFVFPPDVAVQIQRLPKGCWKAFRNELGMNTTRPVLLDAVETKGGGLVCGIMIGGSF